MQILPTVFLYLATSRNWFETKAIKFCRPNRFALMVRKQGIKRKGHDGELRVEKKDKVADSNKDIPDNNQSNSSDKSDSEPVNKWAQHVNATSDAMDLEPGVFTFTDPKKIAQSVLHSTQVSNRKKGRSDLKSEMSMINFYINRAGRKLPQEQKNIINQSKVELRALIKDQREKQGASENKTVKDEEE